MSNAEIIPREPVETPEKEPTNLILNRNDISDESRQEIAEAIKSMDASPEKTALTKMYEILTGETL